MKFRTDFVTNSSSSSFIFQRKYSIEDIRHLRSRLLKKATKSPYSPNYRDLNDDFDYILEGIKTIDKFILETLSEVFSWYRDKIISKLTNDSNPAESEPNTLSDEKLRILAGIWYFDYIVDRYCSHSNEHTSPTYELLEEYVWDYLTVAYQYDDDRLAILITENGERFLTALADVAKMSLYEIFEMITGGKYMYYDSMESDWLASKTLQEDENCLFGCSHMG